MAAEGEGGDVMIATYWGPGYRLQVADVQPAGNLLETGIGRRICRGENRLRTLVVRDEICGRD